MKFRYETSDQTNIFDVETRVNVKNQKSTPYNFWMSSVVSFNSLLLGFFFDSQIIDVPQGSYFWKTEIYFGKPKMWR